MQTTGGRLLFWDSLGDHGVRVALELLKASGGLDSHPEDRTEMYRGWILLETSRPWSERAWAAAFGMATRMVEASSPIGSGTSLLLVALGRESRRHPARDEQLESLAGRAVDLGAPWSEEFDRVLRFRRMLRSGPAR